MQPALLVKANWLAKAGVPVSVTVMLAVRMTAPQPLASRWRAAPPEIVYLPVALTDPASCAWICEPAQTPKSTPENRIVPFNSALRPKPEVAVCTRRVCTVKNAPFCARKQSADVVLMTTLAGVALLPLNTTEPTP